MNEYYIYTNKGRFIRPMVVLENINNFRYGMTFDTLYSKGIIEYIDSYEMLNCSTQTHLELHNIFIVGITTCIIPFFNTNQSARMTFQNSMTKQSIVLTNKLKYKTETKSLIYSQYPICKTIFHDILQLESSGINTIVAVCSFNGFNVEDALIFRKSCVDKLIYSIIKS
jgi:DNA-directed RNA polymerase beta subunit